MSPAYHMHISMQIYCILFSLTSSCLNFVHNFLLVLFHRGLCIFHFKDLPILEVHSIAKVLILRYLLILLCLNFHFSEQQSMFSQCSILGLFYFLCNLFSGDFMTSILTSLSVGNTSESSVILSLKFQYHNFMIF